MDQQLHRSGKVTAADSYNRFGIYKPITSAKIKFLVKPIDNIDKCTDRINIPKLNVSVDALLEADEQNSTLKVDYRVSFETFKSNTCHQVKDKGDLDFIIETLETNRISTLEGYTSCSSFLLRISL